ncbi:MAG TPA: NrfD/PsrC family molybdoenzyme membrane anchor subunit [Gemmatimonadales bacterium]|nr:NrfD/PsrC family molybdoenzyme membrane anchor subunit [Gemmatimonadales bacterium]
MSHATVLDAAPPQAPVLAPGLDAGAIEEQVLAAPLWGATRPRGGWWLLFLLFGSGALLLATTVTITVLKGIGMWGNNIPVAWAYAIINFVWWIGIGHAGTFISAFLLLLNQRWRASVNRIAEAMTIFALVNAGLFPVLHLGRPWFAYWLLPYPTRMTLWPQYKSALPWDLAAISTYFTVSLLFWYLGMVPDLATARDRAPTLLKRRVYGVLALGWRGAASHWHRYRVVYLLLAGLAAPLVVSVHSVVSLDFAITQLPGWHSTIFPPYFVIGALYSGFAMVLILLIPVRHTYRLQGVITERHLEALGTILLVMGWLMAYSYVTESFIGWYSGNVFERYALLVERPTGPYAVVFWVMLACNCVTPQLFWSRRLRRSEPVLFGASLLILVGMWLERFTIIVTSLNRDFLPSSWHLYVPTWVDWSILAGSVGLFGTLFLLFLRYVPLAAVSELKELAHELHGAPHEAQAEEARRA